MKLTGDIGDEPSRFQKIRFIEGAAMTQPKISAEAWERAIADFVKEAPKHLRAQSMYDSAWIKQRARELTAVQPAAGNDAVRALVKKWWNEGYFTIADELEAALATNAGESTGETK